MNTNYSKKCEHTNTDTGRRIWLYYTSEQECAIPDEIYIQIRQQAQKQNTNNYIYKYKYKHNTITYTNTNRSKITYTNTNTNIYKYKNEHQNKLWPSYQHNPNFEGFAHTLLDAV